MDEVAFRTAKHESYHCGAFAVLGWPLTSVTRAAHGGWGETRLRPQLHGDLRLRAAELCIGLLAPSIWDASGSSEDYAVATKLIAAFDLRLFKVLRAAERVVAEPEFTVRQRAVETALLQSLSLDADEVRRLVA